MIAQIFNLFNKELIQFRRDRLFTPFILLGPVLQLMMLAAATGSEMSGLPVAIVDQDQSGASRQLCTAFVNQWQLNVLPNITSAEAGEALIEGGRGRMVVVIPPNFSANLSSFDGDTQLQIIIDGSNAIVAQTLQSLSQGILNTYQRRLVQRRGLVGVDVRPVIRYNEKLDYRYAAIPAELGLIVYMVTMLTAALGISRERERGTMEQLRVTPLRRAELMIGKSVPVLAIASVDFVIMFLIATQFYRIPMRGSWQLLFGLTGMYITVEMGVGLIISSVAHSQQQSLLLVFLIGVLNVAFSGYLVPVKNMPWLLNRASQLFPVQHYMNILRHVMLKGATLADIAGDVAALAALGVVIGGAAYAVVNRRLD